IRAALERARDGFERHRRSSLPERAERLLAAAELLERGKEAYGRLMTREMGKPIRAAVAEAEKCAWACRHYAEHAASYLADEEIATDARRSFVRYEPLGAVLAIMPWNFPFWQLFRCAAPALMAGNVVLLKHAPNVPQCAVAIEGIFRRAGFPEGVFQNLFVEVEDLPLLLDDPIVRGASLTGSVRAGASLASEAGARILPSVLELGGSDPFLVFPSADLDRALDTAVHARMINNGQSCIAAKRILVAGAIADEFEDRFAARVESLSVGDPSDEETEIGPLARADLRETLERQVESSVAAGARVRVGGGRLDRKGWFYRPAVLTEVPEGSPAYEEELFGPVASLFRFDSLDEAIALANATRFGLGAAAWTSDEEERRRCIDELQSGLVFINGMVASDPRLPFGGVKKSGYGRELGPHGIREFVRVKTVWIGGD
ncbi:MAG: NAD-dependent succinate-semialdehyde dehydrogenase, partial [Gemmatimonadota bacterium]